MSKSPLSMMSNISSFEEFDETSSDRKVSWWKKGPGNSHRVDYRNKSSTCNYHVVDRSCVISTPVMTRNAVEFSSSCL